MTAPVIAAPSSRPATAPCFESPAMREVMLAAQDVAATPTTVLLLGEPGAGKGRIAREIHARSQRAAGPLVVVHCAAAAPDGIEDELFGPPSGAPGRVAQAAGGTLFLDEVAELPLGAQARILRVLQEREGRTGEPGVRVIASSSRDLGALAEVNRFRSDLYYRLNVFPIVVPPLRARAEDVAPLAEELLAEASATLGLPAAPLTPEARDALAAHPFPGNVRELQNLVQRALVRCRGAAIRPEHLGIAAARPAPAGAAPTGGLPAGLPLDLGQLERLAIEEALRRVQGNRTHAARLLGIGLRTLRNKLRTWREAGVPALEAAARRMDAPPSPGPAVARDLTAWARGSQLERA